ncbi:hypothetical protein M378DRAFT_183054 [Amanita muscaria Koide BX008]|uniref:DUF7721 domain-containing protein n=1 Tax=Amanita muscaria (strain Koide BX008) TaxID=946122 RepID=A0A0C2XB97_AMAMK|nr:hypothetical protein M378DRAFT_183054 [Amanita muscaria Koide BX008]
MDSFLNLAKQGLEAYGGGSTDVRKTGGQEYNSPHHSGQSGQQRYGVPQIDHGGEAIRSAQQHGSGHGDLFSSALSFVSNNKQAHHDPVDEDSVVEAHRAAYDQEGGGSGLNAKSLGSAAAMQAFKKFTSGGGSSGGSSGGGEGNTQTQLISLAMAEAVKLFDKSGGGSSGSKQDAVNGAAMMAMKLLVQSKFGGTTGGSNSGGLGSLMGLATKFI